MLALLIALQSLEAHRETLAAGTLYVPADYAPAGDTIDLIVHFHGAVATVEAEHDRTRRAAALVTVSYKGLSSSYSTPFADAALFGKIVDEAIAKTGAARKIARPKRGKLVVSSFSAGFGAVGKILPSYSSWITDLVLADSLYCSYVDGKVSAAQLSPYAEFAKKAASGQATMTLSYSLVVPGTYGSTKETADHLIDQVSAPRTAVDRRSRGMRQTLEARKGKFAVRGFEGSTGAEHMKHLQNIGELWLSTSLRGR